jgi:terminase small subunit|uniref:Terminase small subunit n=1 Tax=Siphoviridae sp. ctTic26 TaxID=2823583 RepID=A0A8S5LEN4_9CAUD|nr:MAG TPA: terminase small subunit [Siphoviridae sp. ctTic26]
MNEKQKNFAQEYIKDKNATQAAIRAGYSEKTAYSIGQRLLKNVEIKNYINDLLDEVRKENILSAIEIEEFLSLAIKGSIDEEVIVVEGEGDGVSSARKIKKQIGLRDRIKAAELLGKRYMLFTDKVNVTGTVPVMIIGEDDLEE